MTRCDELALPPGSLANADDVAQDVLQLISKLKALGIDVAQESPFERAVLSIFDTQYRQSGQTPQTAEHDAQGVIDSLALRQMAHIVAHIPDKGFIQRNKKHFELFATADFNQNYPTLNNRDASNKLFELLIGAATATLGTDTYLDDPLESKGDNPDIITFLDEKKCALACKTSNTQTAKSQLESIQAGRGQIERAAVDYGLVVLNVKNLIPAPEMFSTLEDGCQTLKERNLEELQEEVKRFLIKFKNALTDAQELYIPDFCNDDPKSFAGALLVSQSASYTSTPYGLARTLISISALWHPCTGDTRIENIAIKINDSLQMNHSINR